MAQRPRDVHPSPDNGYRLYGDDRVTADLFNGIFTSLHNRLVKAEGKSADYDAAVDRIINQALQTVSASLTVEIEAGRVQFAALRDAFEELQSGGFSAARIAASLDGQGGVGNVQQALTRLLMLEIDAASRLAELERVPTKAEAVAGIDDELRMTPRSTSDAIRASEARPLTPAQLFQLHWEEGRMPRIAGRLGSASITNTDATAVYTVPAGHETTCNINVCNVGSSSSILRLAFAATAAPGPGDWVEYDLAIPPGTPLERTGIIMKAGERIFAQRMSGGNLAVDVRGIQSEIG